jgi:hypothetical protein
MNRKIAVYAIRKQGQKYFLLREPGKPDVRVPIAGDAAPAEAFADLKRNFEEPAEFTLMNEVGPNFSRNLRVAALKDLVPPTDTEQ